MGKVRRGYRNFLSTFLVDEKTSLIRVVAIY